MEKKKVGFAEVTTILIDSSSLLNVSIQGLCLFQHMQQMGSGHQYVLGIKGTYFFPSRMLINSVFSCSSQTLIHFYRRLRNLSPQLPPTPSFFPFLPLSTNKVKVPSLLVA